MDVGPWAWGARIQVPERKSPSTPVESSAPSEEWVVGRSMWGWGGGAQPLLRLELSAEVR